MFSQMNSDSISYPCVEEQAAAGGCTTLTILTERVKHNALHREAGDTNPSFALWCDFLLSAVALLANETGAPSPHSTTHQSVMLFNSCTASNRGAAGFHWLTLQVDAHMPVGNENWFLQIHCTRWLKYFSWIWWRWKGKWESGSAIEKDLHWIDRNSIT